MAEPQSFENHARIIPAYHVVTFGLLIVNVAWSLYRLAADATVDRTVSVLTSVALLALFFFTRLFALTVQDRVIRLEMRLRLERCLPVQLRSRIVALSPAADRTALRIR